MKLAITDFLGTHLLSVIMWGVYLLLIVLGCVHILLHKQEARSKALWLFVVATFPVAGLLLYVSFGMDRVARKLLRKEAVNLSLRQEYAAYLPRTVAAYDYDSTNEAPSIPVPDFSGVLDRICHRPLLTGNHLELMLTGDRVFQSMLRAIEAARHNVNLQTYIFRADKVGRQIVETMIRKAEEGIEMRVLYDPVGSIDSLWFLDELKSTKVRVNAFTPLSPLKRRWQMNLRNHRKLLLVDGRLAFTGGMNVTEMHLIDHPLLTRVKDYHFKVQGPVVHQMQEWFVEDWFYACNENLVGKDFFPPLEWRGEDLARVITSGPDGDYETFYQVIFAAISGARSRIIICTPYFIPDKGLLTALEIASLRGVDITLLVPGHSDHPVVSLAARTFYEKLLELGVRIYERSPPFLHAKAVVVDGEWATVGSANMDVRSFRLNFEANLEIRSPRLVRALLDAIQDDIRHSETVHLATFRNRPKYRQVLESACGLLNPML